MVVVKELKSYEVIDSRGNPTVEAVLFLSDGSVGSAVVPSGASVGKNEAVELRDGDVDRFMGKGVMEACRNVNHILSKELVGFDAFDQAGFDRMLVDIDGTHNFSKLGANATLAVSMALARASSNSMMVPLYKYIGGVNARILPVPMLNIINGGAHSNNSIDFQEYMIMPSGFDTFKDAFRCSVEIYHHLRSILDKMGLSTNVGDEGGFAPDLKGNRQAIELILRAIDKSAYRAGDHVHICIDVASSEFYSGGLYNMAGEGLKLTSDELIGYYEDLLSKYPIVSIEDGLSETDTLGWKRMTDRLSGSVQLVGDDLFVTNEEILREGISNGIANAVLIKPNQIGTVTQTMDTVQLAKDNNYRTIISHRSGDSEDAFIADLAVALNSGEIKTGAPARGERTAKYNRLLKIEHFDSGTRYHGKLLFS